MGAGMVVRILGQRRRLLQVMEVVVQRGSGVVGLRGRAGGGGPVGGVGEERHRVNVGITARGERPSWLGYRADFIATWKRRSEWLTFDKVEGS